MANRDPESTKPAQNLDGVYLVEDGLPRSSKEYSMHCIDQIAVKLTSLKRVDSFRAYLDVPIHVAFIGFDANGPTGNAWVRNAASRALGMSRVQEVTLSPRIVARSIDIVFVAFGASHKFFNGLNAKYDLYEPVNQLMIRVRVVPVTGAKCRIPGATYPSPQSAIIRPLARSGYPSLGRVLAENTSILSSILGLEYRKFDKNAYSRVDFEMPVRMSSTKPDIYDIYRPYTRPYDVAAASGLFYYKDNANWIASPLAQTETSVILTGQNGLKVEINKKESIEVWPVKLFGFPSKIGAVTGNSGTFVVYACSGIAFLYDTTQNKAFSLFSMYDISLAHLEADRSSITIRPVPLGMAFTEYSYYATYAQIHDVAQVCRYLRKETVETQVQVIVSSYQQGDWTNEFAWLFTIGCHRGYWVCPGETLAMPDPMTPTAVELCGAISALPCQELTAALFFCTGVIDKNKFLAENSNFFREHRHALTAFNVFFDICDKRAYVDELIVLPGPCLAGVGFLYYLHLLLKRIFKESDLGVASRYPAFAEVARMLTTFEFSKKPGEILLRVEMFLDKAVILNAVHALETSKSHSAQTARRLARALPPPVAPQDSRVNLVDVFSLPVPSLREFETLLQWPSDSDPFGAIAKAKIPTPLGKIVTDVTYDVVQSVIALKNRSFDADRVTAKKVQRLQTDFGAPLRFVARDSRIMIPMMYNSSSLNLVQKQTIARASQQLLVIWLNTAGNDSLFHVYIGDLYIRERIRLMEITEPVRFEAAKGILKNPSISFQQAIAQSDIAVKPQSQEEEEEEGKPSMKKRKLPNSSNKKTPLNGVTKLPRPVVASLGTNDTGQRIGPQPLNGSESQDRSIGSDSLEFDNDQSQYHSIGSGSLGFTNGSSQVQQLPESDEIVDNTESQGQDPTAVSSDLYNPPSLPEKPSSMDVDTDTSSKMDVDNASAK